MQGYFKNSDFTLAHTRAHTLTGNIEKVLFDALLKLSSQLRLNSAAITSFLKRKRSESKVAVSQIQNEKKPQSLIP